MGPQVHYHPSFLMVRLTTSSPIPPSGRTFSTPIARCSGKPGSRILPMCNKKRSGTNLSNQNRAVKHLPITQVISGKDVPKVYLPPAGGGEVGGGFAGSARLVRTSCLCFPPPTSPRWWEARGTLLSSLT